jgi:hypothetical protein
VHKRFIGTVLGSLPFQYICKLILQCLKAAFSCRLIGHLRILPDEEEVDRSQVWIPSDDIAGNGARKCMPICLLHNYQLFDQPILLATGNNALTPESAMAISNAVLALWEARYYTAGPDYPYTLEETVLEIEEGLKAKGDYADAFQPFKPVEAVPPSGIGPGSRRDRQTS